MSQASSTSVQPILWRITWPSSRTNLEVETPTLAVCGATGLPTSAPTEFNEGNNSTGKPSSLPTCTCTRPNKLLVDVLLPESATPIQPRMGASRMKAEPTFEKPKASDAPIPE